MINDEFVENFLQTDPNYGIGPEGMEDKPTYTRAEVDEIIQRTIKNTMETMTAAMNKPENPENENEEDDENGREKGESNGEDAGEAE